MPTAGICCVPAPAGRMPAARRCAGSSCCCLSGMDLPEAIRSDNGSPFASSNAPLGLSRLSAWWVALGINLDRTDPGHPEQNGAHERMHRDLAAEVQYAGSGCWARNCARPWNCGVRATTRSVPHEASGDEDAGRGLYPFPIHYSGRSRSSWSIPWAIMVRRVNKQRDHRDLGGQQSHDQFRPLWLGCGPEARSRTIATACTLGGCAWGWWTWRRCRCGASAPDQAPAAPGQQEVNAA